MIKECAHVNMEYLDCNDGVIGWTCLDCGEVLSQFEDCRAGR